MTSPPNGTHDLNVLVSGGDFFEAPRWRDGHWFTSDVHARRVCCYAADGSEVWTLPVGGTPSGLGWLPDGSLLIVVADSARVLRRHPDGAVSVHADLAQSCPFGSPNDLVTDRNGRAWTGTLGVDLATADAEVGPGTICLINSDGSAKVAAHDVWGANGLVITSDGRTLITGETFAARLTAFTIADDGTLVDPRVVAQLADPPVSGTAAQMLGSAGFVPDGCAIDRDDHVWLADAVGQRCVRIAPDGAITDEVRTTDGRNVYACALGGEDCHTLLLCVAPSAVAAQHSASSLLVTRVTVPAAG